MQGAAIRFALVVVATFAVAAPGHAAVTRAGGYSYVTTSKNLSGGMPLTSLKAPCPSGTHVYGGGTYNSGGYYDVLLSHSGPYDGGDRGQSPDDGWRTTLDPYDSVATFTHAICAKAAPLYNEVALEAPGSGTGSSTVSCTGIRPILGGGTAGHEYVRQRSSFPVFSFPHAWSFAADNSSGVQRPVRGYAICGKRDFEVEFTQGAGSVSAENQNVATANCPAGTFVLGGGVSGDSSPFVTVLNSAQPVGHGSPSADGWQVYLDNHDTSPGSADFTAWASCGERAP